MLEGLLNLLFPPVCPQCGCAVMTEGQWCRNCVAEMFHPYRLENNQGRREFVTEIWALTKYERGIKEVLRAVKFQQKKELALGLAPFLASFLFATAGQKFLEDIDYVIPVPVSQEKRKERGYNQVDLYFKAWSKEANLPWLDCLTKREHTKAMWHLSRTERQDNLRGAFSLQLAYPQATVIKGKTVLIVDDIYTTGATMHEIGYLLKENGVGKVKGLTIAGT